MRTDEVRSEYFNQQDFKQLPQALGSSWENLQHLFEKRTQLDQGFTGADADYLLFDFSCKEFKGDMPLEIKFFTTQENVVGLKATRPGRMLVPIGILPNWLRAQKISNLSIKSSDSCMGFNIENIKLLYLK